MKQEKRVMQIADNILLDIKKNMPSKELTAGGALSFINGLALMYRMAINDYDPIYKIVYEVNMKEVLFCLYNKRENKGKDCGFNEALNRYMEALPKEFADMVNFNLFRGPFAKKEVEKETAKLTYKVVRKAAMVNMRVKEGKELPSIVEVQKNLNDLNNTKRILKDGLGLEIDEKKGEEGTQQMNNYVESLAKRLISSEVEYATELAESVVRFYSNVELDIQAEAREEYFRNHVYVDRTQKV